MASTVLAQGRTVEETLVVSDPTVAAKGQWKVGGAVEYWYVHNTYDLLDPNGSGATIGSADLNFTQPGFNVFAAYGNMTVQATRRSGKGTFDANGTSSTLGAIHYGGDQKSVDTEVTLRYLFATRGVSPYVIVGYAKTELTQTYDILSPTANNIVWSCNLTRHLENKETFSGPLAGGGAVIPFSQKLGMRADLRLHWNKVESRENGTRAACANVDSSGLSYDLTVTAYYNIIAGLNAQLGFKYQWLNGGNEDIQNWTRLGIFGMLGYTFQF